MDLGIDSLKPFLTLCIDIREGLVGSACTEVVSQVFDSVLYLTLGLGTIGITEPEDDDIVFGGAMNSSLNVESDALGYLSMATCFILS